VTTHRRAMKEMGKAYRANKKKSREGDRLNLRGWCGGDERRTWVSGMNIAGAIEQFSHQITPMEAIHTLLARSIEHGNFRTNPDSRKSYVLLHDRRRSNSPEGDIFCAIPSVPKGI